MSGPIGQPVEHLWHWKQALDRRAAAPLDFVAAKWRIRSIGIGVMAHFHRVSPNGLCIRKPFHLGFDSASLRASTLR